MEAHPSIVEEAMAVEPTDANESAAAPQGAGSEVLLEDTDLESPSKKRKVCCTKLSLYAHVHDRFDRGGCCNGILPRSRQSTDPCT